MPTTSGKSTRKYHSTLRERQAAETRSQVIAAATQQFAADGYTRTTFVKIAAVAGVSAETVCGCGPKAALMIAALERAGFGASGQENDVNLMSLRTVNDRTKAIDAPTVMHAEMFERIAPLASALIGASCSEAELDRYLTTTRASVHFHLRQILDIYRDHGLLRQDIAFDEVVETAAVLCSAETYLQITRRDSGGPAAYRTWLRRSSMCRRQLNEGPGLLVSQDAATQGHAKAGSLRSPNSRGKTGLCVRCAQ